MQMHSHYNEYYFLVRKIYTKFPQASWAIHTATSKAENNL